MSNSINLLLNKEFFRLLKTRRAHKKSWDATQEYLFQISRGEHRSSAGSNPQKSCDISQEDDDVPISIHAPSSLQHDYALDEEDDFSIPLVSMQFALRRMARCTQYCMVCYQRIREEFEALKPYACPNSLCLYQYITLGLGSSIEHEVTKNPYVVDLLVSFFCSAVGSQSLRKYPKGLNLKSVRTGTIQHPAEHIVAEACFKEKVIRLSSLDPTKRHTLKEGASIFVVIEGPEVVPTGSIMDGGLERHVCRVTSAKDDSYTFEILATQTTPLNVQPLPEHEKSTQASCPTDDWKRVLIFQFTHDLDKLPKPDRSVALMLLTAGIPSVLKMRTYLLQNPGRRLVSWNQIDNNSLTLLHWIVASNRSLILQDDAVPSSELTENASNRDGSESPEPMTTNPNKVKGMPETWMQFRFLQGTPEREKLFMKALQSTTGAPTNGKQYPTLFAWHGSPLHNWHSIIRTGLDFRIVANGRTFGNGVYFNPCLAVSCGYAVKSSRNIMHPSAWQNSELRPSSAVSMCEIINRPQDFVSMSPHYVVDKLEWIQCRYLFVEVLPTSDALEQPFPTPPIQDCVGYADQNPRRQLTGRLGNRIQIPLSAVSSQRRGAVGTSEQIYPVKALTKQKNLSSSELADDDDNEIDAALLLDSDDEVGSLNDTRKRRRSPSLDSGSQTSSKLSTAAYKLKNSEENTPAQSEKVFRPGTLDLTSLPRLPDPAWASSSPGALQNLSRAIKELQKIQSQSNITSLGWYIDFDNLNNMFHWIVQLHSFDADLPLAKDMEEMDCTSVVLELRFGGNYPFSPPFVRVIRPRFLPFARGGGGHVTAGGAICSELLTNSGWSPALTIEKVLLQVRLGLCELDPPARLDKSQMARSHPTQNDYGIREAMEAYTRAARSHGWQIPGDIKKIAAATWRA